MEEEVLIKRGRGRPPKLDAEKKKRRKKRGRPRKRGPKPKKGKVGRPRIIKEDFVQNRPKETLIQQSNYLAENFELEHLLIDEQIFYANQISGELAKQREQFSPVLNELDKIIMGQTAASAENLLGTKKTNLPLDKNRVNTNFNKSNNSTYTLDLRKNDNFKISKYEHKKHENKKEGSLFDEFRVKSSALEIPKLSLVKRKFILDKIKTAIKSFNIKRTAEKTQLRHVASKAPWWQNLKSALNFALVALLVVLPIRGVYLYDSVVKTQGKVLGATEVAFNELGEAVSAINSADWRTASMNFNEAENYFVQAQETLSLYNQSMVDFLRSLPLAGKKVADGEKLLKVGELISKSATNFSVILASLNQAEDLEKTISNSLPQIQESLQLTILDINRALELLAEVSPSSLPEEYQISFKKIKNSLPVIFEGLNNAGQLINTAFEVLGYQTPKRYLFLFQNNNELRGSGGFLGSFALVDVKEGKIVNMEIPGGGLYDLKAGYLEKTISPQPMHLLGTPWMPWDQNWWPDFPASAQKLMLSFEKANWPTYDGVIAINASVLPKLLEVVGDIELPEYDQKLTSGNVIIALQHEAEFEYDKAENQPKKIIGDLMPILIERLLSIPPDNVMPLLLTLKDNFIAKDLQLYFADEELQNQARKFGWTGEVASADKDYLMIVRTNVGGNKTDLVISQDAKLFSYIQEDGSVIDTVAITLTHNGNPEDVFERNRNNAYLRVYVPSGSQLLEATGYDVIDPSLFKEIYPGFTQDEDLFRISGAVIKDAESETDINNEFGKTVFGNWVQIDPGESQTLTFSYRLPFRLHFVETNNKLEQMLVSLGFKKNPAEDSYSLLVQNQPGAKNSTFESRLYLPKEMNIEWFGSSNNLGMLATESYLEFKTDLNKDYSYGALISK